MFHFLSAWLSAGSLICLLPPIKSGRFLCLCRAPVRMYEGTRGREIEMFAMLLFAGNAGPLVPSSQMMINFVLNAPSATWEIYTIYVGSCARPVRPHKAVASLSAVMGALLHSASPSVCLCVCVFIQWISLSFDSETVCTSDPREWHCVCCKVCSEQEKIVIFKQLCNKKTDRQVFHNRLKHTDVKKNVINDILSYITWCKSIINIWIILKLSYNILYLTIYYTLYYLTIHSILLYLCLL